MDPGWYDDPFRRFSQRYHDGSDWTEHVSDGSGVSFVDPSGSEPFVAGPPPTGPAIGGEGAAGGAASGPPAPASPWMRLLARLVDGLILGLPLALLTSAIWGADWIEIRDDGSLHYEAAPMVVLTAITALYEISMIAWRGQTLGKMVCRVTVVGSASSAIPGVPAAVVRWIVIGVYSLLGTLGSLLALVSIVVMFVTPRRQMIHDLVARTAVVRSDAVGPAQEVR